MFIIFSDVLNIFVGGGHFFVDGENTWYMGVVLTYFIASCLLIYSVSAIDSF